jgi:hypothetical protein
MPTAGWSWSDWKTARDWPRNVIADVPMCVCDLAGGEVPCAADVNFVGHKRGEDNVREGHCMKYTVSSSVDSYDWRISRIPDMADG